jgi:hypothetical protein
MVAADFNKGRWRWEACVQVVLLRKLREKVRPKNRYTVSTILVPSLVVDVTVPFCLSDLHSNNMLKMQSGEDHPYVEALRSDYWFLRLDTGELPAYMADFDCFLRSNVFASSDFHDDTSLAVQRLLSSLATWYEKKPRDSLHRGNTWYNLTGQSSNPGHREIECKWPCKPYYTWQKSLYA